MMTFIPVQDLVFIASYQYRVQYEYGKSYTSLMGICPSVSSPVMGNELLKWSLQVDSFEVMMIDDQGNNYSKILVGITDTCG